MRTSNLFAALVVLSAGAVMAQTPPTSQPPSYPAPADAPISQPPSFPPPGGTAAPAPAPAAAPEASMDEWAQWSDRKAYRGGIFAVSWLPSFPVGNLATVIPQATVHGLEFDTRIAVKKGLTLGIIGSWNNFWTRQDRATYTLPQGAVTAQLWRYYESFQIRGSIGYHFVVNRKFPLVPYAQLGFGVASNRYEIIAADLTWNKYQTNFAFSADVGTLVDLRFSRSFGAGLLVAFRYQLTTANFQEPTLTTPQNLGFVIGGYSSF
jgi:hypothetical protein